MKTKRPAYEPASRLFRPDAHDPGMKRPVSIIAGAGLVMLSVLAGAAWTIQLVMRWPSVVRQLDLVLDDVSIGPEAIHATLWFVVAGAAVVLVIEIVLAVLIFFGVNWARIVVMIYCAAAITFEFIAWWAQGQDIYLETTLITLAVNILVLLALSGRSSAAYTRRNQRD